MVQHILHQVSMFYFILSFKTTNLYICQHTETRYCPWAQSNYGLHQNQSHPSFINNNHSPCTPSNISRSSSSSNIDSTNIASINQVTRPIEIIYLNNNNVNFSQNVDILLISLAPYTFYQLIDIRFMCLLFLFYKLRFISLFKYIYIIFYVVWSILCIIFFR